MYKNFDRIVTNIKNTLQARNIIAHIQGACNQPSKTVSAAFDQIPKATIQERFVCLEIKNNSNESKQYKFPSVWLRDNCQCAECFHNGSMSRTIDWQKFKYNVAPKSVEVD